MATEHTCPCVEGCPCTASCPLQKTMKLIGGKWKWPILCSLSNDGATRYNAIKRNMKGISNTMLVKSLKELENDGLLMRSEYDETPVRVEYDLTDSARSLVPILEQLAVWGDNLPGA